MTTITTEQQQAIATMLASMTLPRGIGTAENACSIAAINLALTGKLTDNIPACMSEVIGGWIIDVQDSMPDEMRNSAEWKQLLPLAAGTGRRHEKERLEIILDWMWGTVLPTLQPIADEKGFGEEWRMMLQERTAYAATAVRAAANVAAIATISYAAANAVEAEPSYAAVANAAYAAKATAIVSNSSNAAWQQFNPCGLLQKLIEV